MSIGNEFEVGVATGMAGVADAQPDRDSIRLTDREMEILQYLPTRLSTSDIAGCLEISPNTVKTHLRSIYGKFGVRSRNEAILQAARHRLIAKGSEWLVRH